MKTRPPVLRPRGLVEDLVIGGTVTVDRPLPPRLQRFFMAVANPFRRQPPHQRRERAVRLSPGETVFSNPAF